MTKLLRVKGGAGSCASACWTSVTRARYDSLTAICKVNVAEKQHLSNPVPHLPFPFLWLNSFISPLDTTSPQHNVVKCDAHQIIKEARDRSICNAGVELQRSWRWTPQKWRPVCAFGRLSLLIRHSCGCKESVRAERPINNDWSRTWTVSDILDFSSVPPPFWFMARPNDQLLDKHAESGDYIS